MTTAILSPEDHAALNAYITAHPGLTDQQVWDAIHAPTTIPNPTPQGQVPKPFTPSDLLSLVSGASLAKIKTEVTMPLSDLNRSILAQDRQTIGSAVQLYLAFGDITQAEHDAIVGLLTATIPDPSWPATVPGPKWTTTNLGEDGTKTWVRPTGATLDRPGGESCNFLPLEAIAEARS